MDCHREHLHKVWLQKLISAQEALENRMSEKFANALSNPQMILNCVRSKVAHVCTTRESQISLFRSTTPLFPDN